MQSGKSHRRRAQAQEAEGKEGLQALRSGPNRQGRTLFEITEVDRDNGAGWVEYHINFTALGRYQRKALYTTLAILGKREGMKKTTRLHAVDSRKRDAPRYESKPYYAHTTQRVRIGTELSFSGRIDYKSPWWSLDYSGVSVTGTCRA